MTRFAFDNSAVYRRWFDDFDKYTTADWTLTTVETGTGNASEAVGKLDGGVLVVTNDDADDDSDFFQWARETFKFDSSKRLYGKIRCKLSDATQSDFIFGLCITDTTPLDASDGIFFKKDDGDAYLDFRVVKNSTATNKAAVATLADDTYFTAAFYYDPGDDKFFLYVDDVLVGAVALDANAPDDEELTITFGVQNGSAGAKVLSVDYIEIVKER